MAVNYTLRNPKAPIADTPQEKIAAQALVNPFVVLKAAGGRGAELVGEIRDLVGLQTFNHRRIVQFCNDYKVTEHRDKNALRNLLNVLKKSDLELVDPDAGVTMPVNRVHQTDD